MTATIAAIPAALTATLMAFMIDFSHNRFVRVTSPAGQARRHAIIILVAVDHGRSCDEPLRWALMSIVASRIAKGCAGVDRPVDRDIQGQVDRLPSPA